MKRERDRREETLFLPVLFSYGSSCSALQTSLTPLQGGSASHLYCSLQKASDGSPCITPAVTLELACHFNSSFSKGSLSQAAPQTGEKGGGGQSWERQSVRKRQREVAGRRREDRKRDGERWRWDWEPFRLFIYTLKPCSSSLAGPSPIGLEPPTTGSGRRVCPTCIGFIAEKSLMSFPFVLRSKTNITSTQVSMLKDEGTGSWWRGWKFKH